jgi:polyisoprenoid-binding protein YceI
MKGAVLGMMVLLLAPPALPVGGFELRPGEARVEFTVKDNRGGFIGQTQAATAAVTVRPGEGRYVADVEARIDARAIRTGVGLRDGQMRSPIFLHTAVYPFITFSGTVTADAPAASPFKATMRGRLTIRKVTREIEVPLEVTAEEGGYAAQGAVTVTFSEFGLPLPRFLIFVAEDAIQIRLQVRLQPKTPS